MFFEKQSAQFLLTRIPSWMSKQYSFDLCNNVEGLLTRSMYYDASRLNREPETTTPVNNSVFWNLIRLKALCCFSPNFCTFFDSFLLTVPLWPEDLASTIRRRWNQGNFISKSCGNFIQKSLVSATAWFVCVCVFVCLCVCVCVCVHGEQFS
jgi:hypothetical protein